MLIIQIENLHMAKISSIPFLKIINNSFVAKIRPEHILDMECNKTRGKEGWKNGHGVVLITQIVVALTKILPRSSISIFERLNYKFDVTVLDTS